MTSPEQPTEPTYADRVFRSAGGIVGGGLLLAIILWIGGDALFRGTGSTPWLALAAMLFLVPLVIAFSLRPAVYANADRLRIRNPFRTITLPWAAVSTVRAQFSCEALTEDGRKFQLWAVPVSLRQRKRANRVQGRGASASAGGGSGAGSGVGAGAGVGAGVGAAEVRMAQADRTVADLREFAERSASRPAAQGEPTVRWAYEVLGPAAAGLIVLIVLLLVG
ncbi:PH domain-containing protein [Streptomyces scopuliridis]|uniref:Membrane protein n=1 Tax=Streptomyces scopuliridis RB72 TaxID=1440053 RepID=A0A2T7TFN3_9ACTN|nr:PH domain-containing protein [Streptomyces scopuliridis]PVE13974.1 membrane protein [Streptomyces scopuliridis RB72]